MVGLSDPLSQPIFLRVVCPTYWCIALLEEFYPMAMMILSHVFDDGQY